MSRTNLKGNGGGDQIALSNSRKAVSLSSACTTKRFPSSRCASAIQIVRPLESIAANHEQRQLLEQPEQFEDDHDNDNHSNYVKGRGHGTGASGATLQRILM